MGERAKALVCKLTQISVFKMNISVLKAPIPANEVSVFKSTMEEHFESKLIQAKLTSFDPTNACKLLWEYPVFDCCTKSFMRRSFATFGE